MWRIGARDTDVETRLERVGMGILRVVDWAIVFVLVRVVLLLLCCACLERIVAGETPEDRCGKAKVTGAKMGVGGKRDGQSWAL